jgi:hypothetical protein
MRKVAYSVDEILRLSAFDPARRMVSSTSTNWSLSWSMNAIQPLSQATASQVVALLLAHNVTRELVVIAVFLARCMAETIALISPVKWEFKRNDCMPGMATDISIDATAIVVINSMSEYPFCLNIDSS